MTLELFVLQRCRALGGSGELIGKGTTAPQVWQTCGLHDTVAYEYQTIELCTL